MRELIEQALARGYTTGGNEDKTLDPELIYAMADELMVMMDKTLPKTVTLQFENFPKNKSTIGELLQVLLK